ncbi:hypothetical protein A5760_10420 [Mycobacterium colombiense]|uniref:Uncharacterized protein n=1 Tax=Mycobacterium colombiense TaxID=339268 RepID=A0A1A0VJS9_9MYCO|nr:hypothetical protein [Mycobacterium colombiense]OBB83502.1 hypothetical protein A5760_10420 [Mycobacterium colombiense]
MGRPLTIGNDGNHVPMIVIPSPNSGMCQRHFVASVHHDHYSLQRTIEDSLALPRVIVARRDFECCA